MKILSMIVGMMLAAGMTVAVAGMKAPPNPLPKESKAVEKDGLSLAVKLAKTEWRADEPLEFTILLKNVSDKPLLLWGADDYRSYQIVVNIWSDDRGPGWSPEWPAPDKENAVAVPKSQTLEPGQSMEVPVSIKDLSGFHQWRTLSPDRDRPGWWTLGVTRDFQANPVAKGNESTRYWKGKIASRELLFKVVGGSAEVPKPQ